MSVLQFPTAHARVERAEQGPRPIHPLPEPSERFLHEVASRLPPPDFSPEMADPEEQKMMLRGLKEICERSEGSFHRLGLLGMAVDISSEVVAIDPDQFPRIREAIKAGFTQGAIMPAMDHVDAGFFTSCFYGTPLSGLGEESQYGAVQIDHQMGQGFDLPFQAEADLVRAVVGTRSRPEGKPYLVLFSQRPIPEETKGQSPDALRGLFHERGWQGLSLADHAMIQRLMAEQRGNRSFDLEPTFLLDSPLESEFTGPRKRAPSQRIFQVGFDLKKKAEVMNSDFSSHATEGVGAMPVIIIPLENKYG